MTVPLVCLCGRTIGVARAEGPGAAEGPWYVTIKIMMDRDHCRIDGAWARCICGAVAAQLPANIGPAAAPPAARIEPSQTPAARAARGMPDAPV